VAACAVLLLQKFSGGFCVGVVLIEFKDARFPVREPAATTKLVVDVLLEKKRSGGVVRFRFQQAQLFDFRD
jgi:hypothetical protein